MPLDLSKVPKTIEEYEANFISQLTPELRERMGPHIRALISAIVKSDWEQLQVLNEILKSNQVDNDLDPTYGR